MTFPYQRYEIERSPAFGDQSILYRPEVPVRVIGLSGDATFLALLDTGADGTLLPLSIASAIGIPVDTHQTSNTAGLAGHLVPVHPGQVDIEISQDEESYRWTSMVGFVDYPDPTYEQGILGHFGCLDFFIATFVGSRREVELIPSTRFPGRRD